MVKMEQLDKAEELLSNLNLDEDSDESVNRASTGQKSAYKDRKIEHKLKKYESILKNLENINRLENEKSKVSLNTCKNSILLNI